MPPTWSAGILRGQSGECPHRVARVFAKRRPPLTQPSNPDFPQLTHAVTTAVTLAQLQQMAIEPHGWLPPVRPSGGAGPRCCFFRGGVMSDSILWMWHRRRTGIAVSIRQGALALFVPFCNPDYVNSWSDRARCSVPPTGLPPHQWWANGWTLCGDYVSPQLWGDQGVCAIQNMLMVACAQGVMSDCDFIINKRDSACVRLDGCDAMNPLDGYQHPEPRPALVPILSLYSGDQFADLVMPLPSDWERLSRGTFHAQNPQDPWTKPSAVDWLSKRDTAVFRGSLTGTGGHAGTNQRLALLGMHDGVNLDVLGTGLNRRYRYCPLEKAVVIPRPGQLSVSRQNYVPLHRQQELYRYAITIDGHSGADRLAGLASGDQCILKVSPPKHALCPETWAGNRMHAWEHYVPISCDLSDVRECLEWARSHPAACERLRANCKAWSSRERERILRWWVNTSAAISRSVL